MPHAGSVIRWRTSTLISRAEHEHAEVTDAVGRELGAEPPRARDEVGLAGQDRLNHARDLLGLVLPVGVDRRDHLRATRPGEPVAELAARRPGRG